MDENFCYMRVSDNRTVQSAIDHVEEVLKSRISVFDLSSPRDTNHARHKGHGSPRISHARIMKIPLDDVICIPDCRLLHDFK